ncbi:hypothetical protein [Microbacterium sp. P5_E9]
MPYPIDEEAAALDVAFGHLEAGDELLAGEILAEDAVRLRLAEVAHELLGTGRLTDAGYERSHAISRVAFEDVAGAVVLAAQAHPEFAELSREFELERRLRARAHGLQVVIGTEIDAAGGSNYLGAPLSQLLTARVDLAIVPPRVFPWDGPERSELHATRPEAKPWVKVTAALRMAAPSTPLMFFVIDQHGRTFEADADVAGGMLKARIDVDPDSSIAAVGVRAAEVPMSHAVARLRSGEVDATRHLVDGWARDQLARAALTLGDAPRHRASVDRWLSVHPARAAGNALAAFQHAEREVHRRSAEPAYAALVADVQSRVRGASEHIGRAAWNDVSDLTGPQRPLVSTLLLVLDTPADEETHA